MIQLASLLLVALTVAMEAGGESYRGKLGVAWVIQNRRVKRSRSLFDVCLDPYDFSCWDTKSPTRLNLDKMTDAQFMEALKAAIEATCGLGDDVTAGAEFYMNVDTVMKTTGKLPDWWDIDADPASEVKIGAHTFRRHR